jgi:hypothetical protein
MKKSPRKNAKRIESDYIEELMCSIETMNREKKKNNSL